MNQTEPRRASAAAQSMKAKIREAVSTIVEQFRDETGLSVSDVQVRFANTSKHGDSVKSYVLADVDVTLEL
jgi:hypothetical protein